MTEINNSAKTGQERLCPDGYKNCEGYIIPNEWGVVRFDSLFKRLTRKNTENNQNVLTISAQQGLISQMDYYNTLYASENKEGYSLLHKGDFSYNKSYSSDYAYGAIKRLDAYDSGIVSPLYICFTPEEGINSDFYLQYFEAGCFNREIYRIAQEGARNHGSLNVSTEDFFNSTLVFPPLVEQERIAEILMQCDKIIELKQKRIEEEKKKKKYLMQELLDPASGIRLPGFSGVWKEARIGDIAKMFSGGTPTSSNQSYYASAGIPFIRSGEINLSKTALFLSPAGYNNSAAKMVSKGDLLYALYGANSGECYISKIDGAINQAILCIRSEVVDTNYMYYVLANRKDWIVATYLQGGQGNLSGEIIKKLVISYPERKEQVAIYTVLNAQDSVIENLELEVSFYQEKKDALAQLMLTGIVRIRV